MPKESTSGLATKPNLFYDKRKHFTASTIIAVPAMIYSGKQFYLPKRELQ